MKKPDFRTARFVTFGNVNRIHGPRSPARADCILEDTTLTITARKAAFARPCRRPASSPCSPRAARRLSSSSSAGANSKYLPCIVSDQGGFDDHSFNQLGLEGVQQAAKKIGTQLQAGPVEERERLRSEHQEPHPRRTATSSSRPASTSSRRSRRPPRRTRRSTSSMVDDNSIKADERQAVVFDTDEAGFLGGYAAAELLEDRRRRHLRRPADPVGHHLHGRLRRRREVLQRPEEAVKKVIGWDVASQNGRSSAASST